MSNATRVAVTKTPITLDSIGKGDYPKAGALSAQVRQTVTKVSYYPSKRVDNEMSGGLFAPSAFGYKEQEFSSTESRVAWIWVPETMTQEQVQIELDKANANGGVIYRVLSNQPIISKDQQWSIDKGYKTLDDYAHKQVMRYPDGHSQAGELILVNGQIVYRKTFFWPTDRKDEDLRSGEVYMTPELKEELGMQSNNAFAGQSVDTDEIPS